MTSPLLRRLLVMSPLMIMRMTKMLKKKKKKNTAVQCWSLSSNAHRTTICRRYLAAAAAVNEDDDTQWLMEIRRLVRPESRRLTLPKWRRVVSATDKWAMQCTSHWRLIVRLQNALKIKRHTIRHDRRVWRGLKSVQRRNWTSAHLVRYRFKIREGSAVQMESDTHFWINQILSHMCRTRNKTQ